MKKNEIKVGGLYLARVGGGMTTVRVDAIRESKLNPDSSVYEVTNTRTNRKTVFHSAAKFRGEAKGMSEIDNKLATFNASVQDALENATQEDEHRSDPTDTDNAPPAAAPAPVMVPVSHNPLAKHLATRSRTARTVGSLVAGMRPNAEQESILDVSADLDCERRCGRVLVVGAGAGTGKTATLKMLEQTLTGQGQYTAFNSALVTESKSKFIKASCNTTHSLAFRAVGHRYAHRLNGGKMRNSQVAAILGLEPMQVVLKGAGPSEKNTEGFMVPTDKIKTITAEQLAGRVLVAIRRFTQTADPVIETRHLGYIDGIDVPMQCLEFDGGMDSRRGDENNKRVKEYLAPFLTKAWADIIDPNGHLPFNHDMYVKIWQLGEGAERPFIASDYILLDEGQDTAPVFLDILARQTHALLVIVGDDNQQIYEWRGAVNALAFFKDAPRRLLSQSYRFGQRVADVANSVLATLDEKTDLVMRGNPAIDSKIEPVENPRCYLYRTNAGAIGRVMASIQEGKRPHLIGKNDEIINWCKAALDLQMGRGTQHPDLACFDTWAEVEEYSKTDEGSDIRLMVKLVNEFGAEEIIAALKNMPKEKEADLVIGTAHKSKGREWDTVRLGGDFPTKNKMNDADRRLLYVAATRAKLGLDISICPPFCGGYDYGEGEPGSATRFIPGITITYTEPAPMPTEVPVVPEPTVVVETPKQETTQPTRQEGSYSWTKFSDQWVLRGPVGGKVGAQVTVRRRDNSVSTVTIKRVVREFHDAWIYGV